MATLRGLPGFEPPIDDQEARLVPSILLATLRHYLNRQHGRLQLQPLLSLRPLLDSDVHTPVNNLSLFTVRHHASYI